MSWGNSESEMRLSGGSPSISAGDIDDEDVASLNGISLDEDAISPSPSADRAERGHISRKTTIYRCPQFETEVKKREQRLIGIIHNQMAAAGLRDEETLTDLINEACRNEGSPSNVFGRSSECVHFLSERAFLFEKKVTDKYFRNTGFAHREGLVAITRYIQENSYSLHGCRLKELTQYIIDDPDRCDKENRTKKSCFTIYNPDHWQNQPWDDNYFFLYNVEPTVAQIREILMEYPQYFTITEVNEPFVGLKPLAFEIASLWDEELLPPRPTVPFYDKSRLETYVVQIQACTEGYAKGAIWAGKYEGRRTYLLNKNLGLHNINMNLYLGGNPAWTCAHMTLGHRNDLNSIRADPIRSIYDDEERDRLKEEERTSIDLDSSDDIEAVVPGAQVDSEDTLAQRRDLREMISDEQAQIQFVDAILRNGPCSDHDVMNKAAGDLTMFPKTFDAVEFILDRPHLYKLQDDSRACLRPPMERQVFIALFEIFHDNGKEGKTMEQIIQLLKQGDAGEALRELAMNGQTLDSVFKTIKPFVGKITKRDPLTTKYTMLVHFDKATKVLLPHFPNCGPHLCTRQ